MYFNIQNNEILWTDSPCPTLQGITLLEGCSIKDFKDNALPEARKKSQNNNALFVKILRNFFRLLKSSTEAKDRFEKITAILPKIPFDSQTLRYRVSRWINSHKNDGADPAENSHHAKRRRLVYPEVDAGVADVSVVAVAPFLQRRIANLVLIHENPQNDDTESDYHSDEEADHINNTGP